MAHQECSFELKKNGKIVLKTSGQNNLLQTIKEVYSTDIISNLKEVLKTDQLAGMKISGYVSTPNYTRSSKKGYHIYINGRTVKCPVFQKAIDTAYKSLIANGKYPFVVLNLELPPADVDVNVHPTKKEVRYKNTNQVFNFIFASIQAGLTNYIERQSARSFDPQSYTPQPVQQSNIVDFVQPKLESSGEIYFDKKMTQFMFPTNLCKRKKKIFLNKKKKKQNNVSFCACRKRARTGRKYYRTVQKHIYFG